MVPTRLGFMGEGADFLALAAYFEARGYPVERLRRRGDLALAGHVDLLVLQAGARQRSHLDVCRRSRSGELPPVVLVFPALDDGEAAIAALEAGAADVLARPFHPREALARVRAVLRRRLTGAPPGPGWAFGGWVLDPRRRELRAPDGAGTVLPRCEFALLSGFVAHPQRVISRSELARLSPAADGLDGRVMDTRISRLRARFARAGGRNPIETVRGEGYRFALPVRTLD